MRRRYHITRRSDGEWQGKLEKGKRASMVGETQADVISAMATLLIITEIVRFLSTVQTDLFGKSVPMVGKILFLLQVDC